MEKLISEVLQVMNAAEQQRAVTGEAFNIYKVAGIDHDEVKTCRVIYELINPNGAHYQGNVFLKMFIKDVLHQDLSEDEIKGARVFREYHIPDTKDSNNDRRIDLVVQTTDRFIPIEVKLYAEDQDTQCKDYYEFAKQYQKNPVMYYLTIDGKKPSEESSLDIPVIENQKEIQPGINMISFSKEVLIWLENCEKYCYDNKLWPIYEGVKQFASSLRMIVGKLEDKEGMDISEKIIESADALKAAEAIASNIQMAKNALVNKVLEAIEKKIDEDFCSAHNIESSNDTKKAFYYENIKWLDTKESLPGISYRYKNVSLPDGKELWLRIEIDNCLYVGFIVFDPNNKNNNQFGDIAVVTDLSDAEKKIIENSFKGKTYIGSQEYVSWEYLKLPEAKNDRINFWHLNEDAFALCDASTFDKNIEFIVKSIGEYINRTLK